MNQYDLQVRILAVLKAYAGLTSIVAQRIFDTPTATVAWPYVTLGESIVTAMDTKGEHGTSHLFTVNAWSNNATAPKAEVKRIQDQVDAALHGQTLVVGTRRAHVYLERLRIIADDDQPGVWHGISQYRCLIP